MPAPPSVFLFNVSGNYRYISLLQFTFGRRGGSVLEALLRFIRKRKSPLTWSTPNGSIGPFTRLVLPPLLAPGMLILRLTALSIAEPSTT